MAFRKRRRKSMPELNLVPMMDVLMTVLTFFIIISMTLSGAQMADIALPGIDDPEQSATKIEAQAPALVVGLNAQGQILIADQVVTVDQLAQAMAEHYTNHADGVVLLKADRGLHYRQVSQLLKTMRDIGGDRVSLAINKGESP